MTSSSARRSLFTPGVAYQVRVRVVSGPGVSPWSTSSAVIASFIDDGSPRATYGGTWTAISNAAAYGHSTHRSSGPGATAMATLSGSDYAVVLPTGPGAGEVRICVAPSGINQCRTINLASFPAMARRAVVVATGLGVAPRQLVVTVLSGTVDLDAFEVLAPTS